MIAEASRAEMLRYLIPRALVALAALAAVWFALHALTDPGTQCVYTSPSGHKRVVPDRVCGPRP